MKQKLIFILLLSITLGIPFRGYSQHVGLVLSGGGAKGLAHIGVIRALEENNIPIDYIAGTSIGAIVGSLYAMGYSPDEMERLLKSDDFRKWYSGTIDEKYLYYFKKSPPTPDFLTIPISINGNLKRVRPQFLPSSLVNPIQMNLVFMEYFGQANAVCENDFNRLFVPFRCIASDIYRKRPVEFSHGNLGDAVRASMSFPGMFKPILVDSTLLYDGGIYNNFPVDVMKRDFHPDIIIGSVVSSESTKPKEGDLVGHIESMIMQDTDYSLDSKDGVLMKFDFKDVGLMDFDRYDELHDKGYNMTMAHMAELKSRISRRMPQDKLELRRQSFKRKLPPIRFRNVFITGTNYAQQRYIQREFHEHSTHIFSMEDMRKAYFRLLSDNQFAEIIPHMDYRPADETFDLRLHVKIEDEVSLRVGGNVGSNGSNAIYAGLTYHNFNNFSKEFSLDAQLGQIYNDIEASARFDLPTSIPTSFRILVASSHFNYYNQGNFFMTKNTNLFNQKSENFVKLSLSLPFLSSRKAEFTIGAGILKDSYFSSNTIDFANDRQDASKYSILGGSIALEGNILNRRQFATAGWRERLSAQVYTGKEDYQPAVWEAQHPNSEYIQSWLQLSYEWERYFPISSKWVMGTYLKGYYSSRNFSRNYRATMMQAGEFAPTAHSRISYNEAFRANHFIGAGITPIFNVSSILDFRLGIYGFQPIFPIISTSDHQAEYGTVLKGFQYMSELNFVLKLPFGSVSAYLNHYSSPRSNWNVGLTLGWQLFGATFMQ